MSLMSFLTRIAITIATTQKIPQDRKMTLTTFTATLHDTQFSNMSHKIYECQLVGEGFHALQQTIVRDQNMDTSLTITRIWPVNDHASRDMNSLTIRIVDKADLPGWKK